MKESLALRRPKQEDASRAAQRCDARSVLDEFEPRWPPCFLPEPLRRGRFGAEGRSEDGGIELFRKLWLRRRSNSSICFAIAERTANSASGPSA